MTMRNIGYVQFVTQKIRSLLHFAQIRNVFFIEAGGEIGKDKNNTLKSSAVFIQ